MNENINTEIFDKISSESLDTISKVLDDSNSDGLALLAALLAIPDKDFEILRPVFQDSMVSAYNDPQNQITLVQLMGQSGITVEDLVNHSDEIADNLFNNDEVELSQPKKDFIKFIFSAAANAISASTINPAHIVEIPVILCRENAKLPTYSTNGSAAMDIYSPEEYTIECGQTIIIPTGIKVAIPHGYALLIQPRSGMSARTKLRIANTPGLIDEDYHEEIGVIVENIDQSLKDYQVQMDGEALLQGPLYGSSFTIGKGERFAQLRLIEVPRVRWRQVESFGGFEEDHGKGFGSTGAM